MALQTNMLGLDGKCNRTLHVCKHPTDELKVVRIKGMNLPTNGFKIRTDGNYLANCPYLKYWRIEEERCVDLKDRGAL